MDSHIIDKTYWVLLKMISFARSISNFARTILHWPRRLFLKTTNVLAIFPKKLAVAVLCAASIGSGILQGVFLQHAKLDLNNKPNLHQRKDGILKHRSKIRDQ